MYIYTDIYPYMNCIHVFSYTYMFICIHTYLCMHIHTRIQSHVHRHTQIGTNTLELGNVPTHTCISSDTYWTQAPTITIWYTRIHDAHFYNMYCTYILYTNVMLYIHIHPYTHPHNRHTAGNTRKLKYTRKITHTLFDTHTRTHTHTVPQDVG